MKVPAPPVHETPRCWSSAQIASSVNEFLNEIGRNHSSAAVQMNSVSVKEPSVHSGNFVGASTKNECAQSVAVQGKESKRSQRASWRYVDLGEHCFVERNIPDVFPQRDILNDCAVLLQQLVNFALEGVRRIRIFSDRRQRAECCLSLIHI